MVGKAAEYLISKNNLNFYKNKQPCYAQYIHCAQLFVISQMNICKTTLRYFLLLVCTHLCMQQAAFCQYYYTDIVALQQAKQTYALLKKNNITLITATSTDDEGQPVEGFLYKRELKDNAAISVTTTALANDGASFITNYYQNNRLAKSVDSSDKVLTTTEYKYNSDGLTTINTKTDDAFMDVHSNETHRWFYSNSMPDSMWRIKNDADTTFIRFEKDSSGYISDELWQRKGKTLEHYFYYYNDAGLLTDVVRYNSKAAQLLPDYLFNYNEAGQLTELTQVPQGFSNYTTWQYMYSAQGLKVKDVLLDKHRQLLGTVSYTYK